MQARISDELLGRKHNIIGQETVGVGGFAKARRTIPEVLKVAEAMESHAPGATLLNYTNPAGIVTNAIFNSSRVQVIGLCSIPNDYRAQAALGCGCKPEEVELDYVGLNHFGFIRDVKVNGVSRWAEAFPYMREHTVEEEWGHIPGLAEKMREHIDHLGVMLTYYLQYYLETDLVLAAQQQSSQTRGQYILERIEPELAAAFADDSVCELPEIAKERGGSGYSRAAFELMSGIFHDTEEKRIVCCKNNGALPFLPHAACVEVPALISRKGAEAIEQPEVSPELAGMIAQMCHYETLTARSAYPPNLRTALDALQANPLASREPAKVGELLKEILDKDAAWL
jgi:6-phospho-beta-glucosidase